MGMPSSAVLAIIVVCVIAAVTLTVLIMSSMRLGRVSWRLRPHMRTVSARTRKCVITSDLSGRVYDLFSNTSKWGLPSREKAGFVFSTVTPKEYRLPHSGLMRSVLRSVCAYALFKRYVPTGLWINSVHWLRCTSTLQDALVPEPWLINPRISHALLLAVDADDKVFMRCSVTRTLEPGSLTFDGPIRIGLIVAMGPVHL